MSIKPSENLIYRANIFNYDNKYFEDFSKVNSKTEISMFSGSAYKVLLESYPKFQSFINFPIEEQIAKLFTLIGLLSEEESEGDSNNEVLGEVDNTRKIVINKEAKVFIQVAIDLLHSSSKLLEETELEIRTNSGLWDISTTDSKKAFSSKIYANVIHSLLYLDGIIMTSVELAAVIELLSDNVGVNIIDSLFNILHNKKSVFPDQAKEVACHILSSIQVFSIRKEYGVLEFKALFDWLFEYNSSFEKRKDNFLTSNLYIILSNDKGLQCFLEEYSNKALKELIGVMSRDVAINIIYECIFCIWNIANSSKYITILENNTEGILDKLIQVIKLNKVEKIIRIGALCVKVSYTI